MAGVLGSVHSCSPSTVLARHNVFLSAHARIRARCRCPSKRSRSCTRAQKWTPGPRVHTIFVSSGPSTALVSLLSSCFKMASDRAKWSNYMYVNSYIGYSKCVRNTMLCQYPGTGSRASIVESPFKDTTHCQAIF